MGGSLPLLERARKYFLRCARIWCTVLQQRKMTTVQNYRECDTKAASDFKGLMRQRGLTLREVVKAAHMRCSTVRDVLAECSRSPVRRWEVEAVLRGKVMVNVPALCQEHMKAGPTSQDSNAGRFFKMLVLQRGLTLREVAKAAGLTYATVRNVGAGCCCCPVTRWKIEAVLNSAVWSAPPEFYQRKTMEEAIGRPIWAVTFRQLEKLCADAQLPGRSQIRRKMALAQALVDHLKQNQTKKGP